METYLIVIGKTATGYSAHCPDVPGCASMLEDGDPIPGSGDITAYREVMKDLDVEKYVLAHVQIDIDQFAKIANA